MALISLFNIDKNYDIKQLLKGVDFSLNEGERVAIVGQNGCGKSTFLNILSTLLKPNIGNVIYNNKNIYECKEDDITQIRRDDFGIIFQSHYLFRGFNEVENLSISSILNNQDIDYDLLKELKISYKVNHYLIFYFLEVLELEKLLLLIF